MIKHEIDIISTSIKLVNELKNLSFLIEKINKEFNIYQASVMETIKGPLMQRINDLEKSSYQIHEENKVLIQKIKQLENQFK
jgi:hypothetical protein